MYGPLEAGSCGKGCVPPSVHLMWVGALGSKGQLALPLLLPFLLDPDPSWARLCHLPLSLHPTNTALHTHARDLNTRRGLFTQLRMPPPGFSLPCFRPISNIPACSMKQALIQPRTACLLLWAPHGAIRSLPGDHGPQLFRIRESYLTNVHLSLAQSGASPLSTE